MRDEPPYPEESFTDYERADESRACEYTQYYDNIAADIEARLEKALVNIRLGRPCATYTDITLKDAYEQSIRLRVYGQIIDDFRRSRISRIESNRRGPF